MQTEACIRCTVLNDGMDTVCTVSLCTYQCYVQTYNYHGLKTSSWAKSVEDGDFLPSRTAPRPLSLFSWNLKYITISRTEPLMQNFRRIHQRVTRHSNILHCYRLDCRPAITGLDQQSQVEIPKEDFRLVVDNLNVSQNELHVLLRFWYL